jgi:GDP-4-dehydro-6-deoxy-D-mannose reductase
MAERILITGITGFVGSHMADYIFDKHPDCEIYGLRRYHLSRMDHVRHIEGRIKWVDCNLTDPISVRKMMDQVKPDRVFHFAAESFVSPSWDHPTHYMRVNYDCTVNLLDALYQSGSKSPFHIPGSGEEYGEILESELPINEQTILRPVNPYAVTKIAQDLIGYVYYKSYGVNVIRTRAFNHEGPRRDKVFGIPWYAYQVACVEAGIQEPVLKVGHIDDLRNFTHVKDMVEAYWLSTEKCEPGKLYLIGSEAKESTYTFRQALEMLIEMSSVKGITHETDPKYVRPTNVPFLVASIAEFNKATGWKPKISFDTILSDTLAYWRQRVANGTA